jgi:hypothetical protein
MKVLIGTDIGSYAFDKTAKTVTISGVSLTIEKILLVVNLVSDIIIYSPIVPGKGGTFSGGVLSLNYDTSAMNNADELQIWVAIPSTAATSAKQDTGNTSIGNIDTKIGEVQATPTTNSLLGRLKDLWDKLTTTNSSLSNIDGKLPTLVGGKVPVDIGTPAITISSEVEIKNDSGNPVPISGTF